MTAATHFRPYSGLAAILAPTASAALLAFIFAIPAQSAAVKDAARFYHQGLYDSSLTLLETVKTKGDLRRRDSLSLFQYQGMASARLGREPEAVAYFGSLLGLDSLFQFPRNEDPDVLRAFSLARESRNTPAVIPEPVQDSLASPRASAALGTADPSPGILLASSTGSGSAFPSTATDGVRIPISNLHPPDNPALRAPPSIGFAMGALPLGTGWFARNKIKHGLVLGLLQAGGIALSIYASEVQSRGQRDIYEVEGDGERATLDKWQWVQRVSLSTAVGAYLFSLIASTGDR